MLKNLKKNTEEIIFGHDTFWGKFFDIALIIIIILSVLIVILDSVQAIHIAWGGLLFYIEWIFTGLFTIEYITRMVCSSRRYDYMFSFYGIIDLLTLIPTYLSIFLPVAQYFTVIRILRCLRVFRVLKLVRYIEGADTIMDALVASRYKIIVFLLSVLTTVTVIGTLMYVVEGAHNGFHDIPTSIYWAIVTLTTVGYGDFTPDTGLGKLLASLVMILGYGVVAVPTGIVTAQIATHSSRNNQQRTCHKCHHRINESAVYCSYCGQHLSSK